MGVCCCLGGAGLGCACGPLFRGAADGVADVNAAAFLSRVAADAVAVADVAAAIGEASTVGFLVGVGAAADGVEWNTSSADASPSSACFGFGFLNRELYIDSQVWALLG